MSVSKKKTAPQADKKAGNAEILADMIAEGTGGDLYSLKTVKKYPSDYDETVDLAQEEQDAKARPELQEIPDMSSYDTVFISFPNWWGTYPMAVATFLDKVDLKGKNVIPVCTHEGSRMGRSQRDLENACKRDIYFMWLLNGMQVPDATTFARFQNEKLVEVIEDLQDF